MKRTPFTQLVLPVLNVVDTWLTGCLLAGALTATLFSCTGNTATSTDRNDTLRTKQSGQPEELVGIAVVEPADRITPLSAPTAGLVKRIDVAVGQAVKRGQPLLVMDDAVESVQLRQANVKISTQQEAIETARQNGQTLRVQLQKAEADLARNQTLFAGNALTRRELDDSQYQVASLNQQIRASQAQIRQAEGQIRALRADIQYAGTVAGLKTVKAPTDGTLLSLDAHVGQYLGGNQSLGDFAPAGPLVAVTEIDELFALNVKVGQRAYLRPQGSNQRLSTGTVVLTSPYLRRKSLFSDNAANLEDRRVREVRVRIDNPDKVLIGARVECIILMN
jgi:multidrug efflux pump subunit AcrA (membrane-fusion protein)